MVSRSSLTTSPSYMGKAGTAVQICSIRKIIADCIPGGAAGAAAAAVGAGVVFSGAGVLSLGTSSALASISTSVIVSRTHKLTTGLRWRSSLRVNGF